MAKAPGTTRTIKTLWGDEVEEDDVYVEIGEMSDFIERHGA